MSGSQAYECLNDLDQLLLTTLQAYDKEHDVDQMLLAALQELKVNQLLLAALQEFDGGVKVIVCQDHPLGPNHFLRCVSCNTRF